MAAAALTGQQYLDQAGAVVEKTKGKGSGWLLAVLCQVQGLIHRPQTPDEHDLETDATFRNLLVLQLEQLKQKKHEALMASEGEKLKELLAVLHIHSNTGGEKGGMASRSKPSAHEGYYDDAVRVKQNTVLALTGDVFSGITAFSHRVLTKLAKRARDGRDGTVYGEYSTGSYYAYHAGAISMSVICAEGERLEKGMQKIEAKLHRPHMRRADEAAAAGGA